MCCFDKPYYSNGYPVEDRGHIDDYVNQEISTPGMYTFGHSGCWHVYFDGKKIYNPGSELPNGMYWKRGDLLFVTQNVWDDIVGWEEND